MGETYDFWIDFDGDPDDGGRQRLRDCATGRWVDTETLHGAEILCVDRNEDGDKLHLTVVLTAEGRDMIAEARGDEA